MKVLEIDTTKSLYRPLEIKIDSETFKVKAVTLDALEHIQALREEAAAGSAAAIRRMLEETLEGRLELLGKLTIDKVVEVVEFAVSQTVKPEPDQKNGPAPEPTQ